MTILKIRWRRKNEYSSSGNIINSTVTHLLDYGNIQNSHNNTKKLQSGWKDENDIGEKGSDHIPVDEAGKLSGEKNHYQTCAHVDNASSRTLDVGSEYIGSIHNAQDRKKRAASIDLDNDSDFLEFSNS